VSPAYRKILRERSKLAAQSSAQLDKVASLRKKGQFDRARLELDKAQALYAKIRELDAQLTAMGGLEP
jgi:hypothetical protein